ncbi:MAG: hypothetical protein HY814_04515 [Candidatus Riflebacteria bacterium]|nr:hypothetical protein [Candidatus Riflebacteria bacterium]
MRHDFWDRYAGLAGPVQGMDPRAKLLFVLAFVIAASGCPGGRPGVLAGLGALLLPIAAASGVPARYLLTRTLWVLPFLAAVAVGQRSGPVLAELAAKGLLSAMALVLLSSTTPFSTLLAGLSRLGAPSFFLAVLAFVYRYVFLLVDESERMVQGLVSRSMGRRPRLQVLAAGLGVLLVRTHERAERVYQAMLGRGFGGGFPPRRPLCWRARDSVVLAAAGALLAWISLIRWGAP